MATTQWIGFIHSWHTLGIVLKWMCITVVGIPFAIVTCLLVALAALIFFGLLLLGAFLSCILVCYILAGIYEAAVRFIDFVVNSQRVQQGLPTLEPRRTGIPTLPIQVPRIGVFRLRAAQRPEAQPARANRDLPAAAGGLRAPPQAHLRSQNAKPPAGPVSSIPGTVFECQVCLEEKERSQFPIRHITDECKHEQTSCCTSCLSESITSAFGGNMWDDIRCPICNLQLCHRNVAEFATKEVFERQVALTHLQVLIHLLILDYRYDAISTRRALEREIPNFRWCLGPGCSFGQEHPDDPSEQPMTICSACGFVACARHNVPWHTNETCEAYDRRIAAGREKQELKSEKKVKKIAKMCPGCQRYINKNGGCNHMSCEYFLSLIIVNISS